MFENKVVLITGASRGIGQGILRQFASHKATVIGTATTTEGAEAISAYLRELGSVGMGVVMNVAQPDSVELALKTISETYSMPDILVNNAGITRDNILLRMKDDEWNEVIETNLTAIFRLTKLCLRHMIKAHWGRIINLSSVSGFIGNPGQANYAAAKAGLIGFSKSLAREIASRQVTVNVVAPGMIDTDMTKAIAGQHATELLKSVPMGRIGNVDEIAAAVLFFASPMASYITGETLHVNGGMYMG